MSKHIGKNVSENLNSKKLKTFKRFLITLNNAPQMPLKFLQKEQFKKTAKATGNLVINKIVDKITKVSRTLPQDRSNTVESGAGSMAFDREIAWEKSEKRSMEYQKQKICWTIHQINNLSLGQKIGSKQKMTHEECITLILH